MTLIDQMQLGAQTDATIRRFELEVGPLWPYVAPLVARYQRVAGDSTSALAALADSLRATVAKPSAKQLANDLKALLPGWQYFSSAQRCVLQTAAAYLSENDEVSADETSDGRADDDIVVAAAVRVLLRRSRS